MAFTPIVIDGGGKPEPDEALLRRRVEAVEAIETSEDFWVAYKDGEGEWSVVRYGDALEQSAAVEELGRARKMVALGLWGDE